MIHAALRTALLSLLLLTGLTSCARKTDGGSETITLGMTTWVGYGPIFLARDLGYFRDAGLDVQIKTIEEASIYMAAMASARLDGTASTLDEIMKYRSKDNCFHAVLGLDDSFGGDGVIATDDVRSLQQLRGRQVGLNEGSTSEFFFNTLAEKAGMKESDFQVTNLTADDAAAAFLAGRLPAAVTWEPHLSLVRERHKGHVLVDSTSTPGTIVDVLALRCDVISKQPKAVKALVDGVLRAVEYTKVHPDDAYARMAKSVGGYVSSPAEFAKAARTSRYFDRPRAQAFFADPQHGQAAALLEQGNRIWGGLGKMKMMLSYGDMIDPSFVKPS